VIFTLFRFYTNHIYDTAHSDIIFCLCCYVVENLLLNRDREKEQDMEAAAVEAAAEEAPAEEAPAEIEDNGEDNDEGDEEDNDEGEEEGQMEDHRALRAPKPILFPGEG
jgi:flagellar biosynthesis/type III secretory pathway M-ring protein FliF/YscJ